MLGFSSQAMATQTVTHGPFQFFNHRLNVPDKNSGQIADQSWACVGLHRHTHAYAPTHIHTCIQAHTHRRMQLCCLPNLFWMINTCAHVTLCRPVGAYHFSFVMTRLNQWLLPQLRIVPQWQLFNHFSMFLDSESSMTTTGVACSQLWPPVWGASFA